MGECSGIMIDSNFKMSGSSGDELDVSVQSTTPVELDDEDDSMDSSNMPPNTSSVTDDSKSHTESVSKAASREHTPTSNHLISNMVAARDPYLSSVNNDRSDSPSANLDLRLRLEQDNLRIRNAEQLLSPEILKQMRHDEAMRFRDLRNEEVFKMHFRDENLRAQLNGNLRLANEVAKLRVKETVSLVPPELELRDAGEGVWSLRDIPRGTRYGPFLGKWASEPIDPRYAWEVCAGSGVRGWLDGSPEPTNWMKFIRTVGHGATNQVNVHHFLVSGQLWYETCRDVPSGTELLLGQRTPLQLQDLLAETAGSEDRSDRETGSQHSGTVDDEREDAEDEEADSRCHVCDRVFTDVDQFDDHLINSHRYPADQHRCELCPKSYSHRPCLVRHRAQAHGDLRKYPCENCTKVTVFTDPSNLQRHIRTHHVGARSHACPECGKTFATSSGLKQHTHIHSSVKPFQCEVCFKAYTQFSNLCRHKRMHADCRMQIKCVKCGQSFSTVTSLSKHKRFCDSTNPSAGPMNHPVTPTLPLSNHMPMANNNPYHQFLMHRPTATLPFMPPNFNPYPLFHPSGPPPNIFNNALLFGNQLSKLGQQQEDISNKLLLPSPPHLRNQQDMPLRTSPETPKTIANADRYTPPRNSNLVAKVSPPTAEEASSHLRPSPARPPVSSVSNTTIFNNPREELNESNKTPSNNTEVEDETFPKDLSKNGNSSSRVSSNNNKKSSSDKKSGESNSATKENEGELPLDLSVSRKRSHEVECNSTLKNSKKMKTPSPYQQIREDTETEDEDIKSDNGRTDIEVIKRDDTPPPQTIIDKISITSTPPMAYPTPIHPRLLEAMYRPPHFQGFPGLPPPSQSERLLPPPQGPYGPARGFSFLGLAQQRNYELLRSGGPGASLPPGFGNVKPFQDLGMHHAVPSHHHHHHHQSSGSKLKDRYACKFCGKVFPRSANLTRHLRTHTGEQPYKCKYCERSFSISSNLQRHVRNIHNKEKPFKCPLCERCFGQQTNLDRHLKKHDSDDGSVVGEVADSPGSSNENERLDSYFEDIRSFMGKALPGGEYNNLYNTSPHSNQVIDVVGKDEDDSEECNEELRRSSSAHDDNTSSRVASSTSPYPTSLKQEKDERLNNNEQPIEIST